MTVEQWLGANNQLGIDIWKKKYQRCSESFDDWLERVSGGDLEVAALIQSKQFLFGGRILSNRGIEDEKVTYSNCYVISPPEDNIESIYDTAKKLARTYSYGGGCGIDISNLAPAGAKVNNQAKSTSGAVSFMDTFSQVTEQIGQNGRRGALMISINCTHPDLEKFITVKSDLGKVTSANISVRVTDKFMVAVKNDLDWELYYKRKETGEEIRKVVKARAIFDLLCKNNWDYAEPGILYWDRISNWSLLGNDQSFQYAGVNPCAEEPLPAGGSCLLGAINLAEFVGNGKFKWRAFDHAVSVAVRALNNVLDEGLEKHPLEEQRHTVKDWRQIGLGIMGLADMLIQMGIRYGSRQSQDLCNSIGFAMARSAIRASAELARDTGRTYDQYNPELVPQSPFFVHHIKPDDTELRGMIEQYGLLNSQLLTIAPTGSISTMLGVSGGIEPIFANSYDRMTKSLHDHDEVYKVYTPIVKAYMDTYHLADEKELPDFFVTSSTIPIRERIEMQSVWQSHIDASISSTVNLPHEATIEDVKQLYMYAWERHLKGITVYRAGCKRAGILTEHAEDKENSQDICAKRGEIMDVPESLTYHKYKISTGCGKLYLFVGIDDATGTIYDFFTNTDGVGGCTVNTQAVSRLMSACVRGGIAIEYVIEQLQKAGTCPSFQYARGKGKHLSVGKSCASAIANVLKEISSHMQKPTREQAKTIQKAPTSSSSENSPHRCPECGAELVEEGGCNVCKMCGFSNCDS